MRTIFLVPVAAFAVALSLSEPGGQAGSPPPKGARLEHAAQVFLDEGRSAKDAGAALLDLLDEAVAGKAWSMPASVVRLEDAAALVKRDLDGAVKALREGRAADEVRLLLEAVLVVVTPMHAPAGRS